MLPVRTHRTQKSLARVSSHLTALGKNPPLVGFDVRLKNVHLIGFTMKNTDVVVLTN